MKDKMDNILVPFYREPEREFHIRELAKILRRSPTTVADALHSLVAKGMLVQRRLSNHVLVRAAVEREAFRRSKLLSNLRGCYDSGLIDSLIKAFHTPEAIVVFGSYRRGEDGVKSDIDILVITPVKKDVPLQQVERALGRRIQLFVHSRKEIEALKTSQKELVNNWLNGIVVAGFWEVMR